MAFRYVLPLLPIPAFWVVSSWTSQLPGWLSEALTICMFFAAIIGGAMTLSYPTGRLSRKRVVVVMAFLWFMTWLGWVVWLVLSVAASDPLSANVVVRILAWPFTLLELLAKHPSVFESQMSVVFEVLLLVVFEVLLLVATIAFMLPPTLALSILGRAALRRVSSDLTGSHPLSGRQCTIAIFILLFVAIGVFYGIAVLGNRFWERSPSVAMTTTFLMASLVLAYLLQPIVTRWRNCRLMIWSSSILLLIILVSFVALPFSSSKSSSPWLELIGAIDPIFLHIPSEIVVVALFTLLMIITGIALCMLFSACRRVGLSHPTSTKGLCAVGVVVVGGIIVFATSAGADHLTIGGVSAYDGETWQTFTALTTEGFSSAYEDILQDSHGYLWVAGPGGVSRYDGAEWQTIAIPWTSEVGQAVADIFEDLQGRMWFAAWGGLAMYDGRQWRYYTEPFQRTVVARW